jgi:hypothetical protein
VSESQQAQRAAGAATEARAGARADVTNGAPTPSAMSAHTVAAPVARSAGGSSGGGLAESVRRSVRQAESALGVGSSGTKGNSAAGTSSPKATATKQRRTRKARLRLSRIDPWSVMKTSFLFAIAGGIIMFVAVSVVWGVVNASGAFTSINTAINDLLASPNSGSQFALESYINTQKVMGYAAMIAAANVVIFTALATLFSFLYNLAAVVLGGLEVTLAED